VSNPEADRTILFIYGTLKRGASNHAVLAGQTYLGDATTVPGYRLFLVADYPGLVKDTTDQRGVQGELWSVASEALARLDAFEGVPEKLYRRAPIALLPPDNETTAETYLYLRNTRGRRPIIDGLWPVDGVLMP